ncbi:MAG: GTPase [Pirellulales bacterium]
MSYDPLDTIAAIATADGGAARGMVRVSGPATAEIVTRCFTKGVRTLFDAEISSDPFSAAVAQGSIELVLDDSTPRPLPCDLFFWPTNRSYTREPVAEFHTLGSPPLLRAVLEAVCRAGARLAEPGEFTLRAFLAGRFDLTQAEAVLGVIDAHGTHELHAAVEQLAGNLARPLQRLRDELLTLLAELEAGLDFVEEDIEFISDGDLTARLQTAAAELAAVADQMSSRHTTDAASQVVLLGPPNAGKSSLFNALVNRFGAAERSTASAIVSEIRGTTRDYLTAAINFAGNRCELVDTAGIVSELDDLSPIAAAAQNLMAERRVQSLVRLLCVDATCAEAIAQLDRSDSMPEAELIVFTKTDLAPPPDPQSHLPAVATSSVTGRGLDELACAIAAILSTATTESRRSCVAATADRCRDSVRLADAAVARAAEIAATRGGDELVAAEIHVALAELGKVVGAVYTDDLLDRIFKTFCIGK